ncbi:MULTISPECIES: hypothetical protein [Clostridium]|uniref:Uncharacterized protein n=1 Tax=Clostridium faecium TaxID=2762223 RepID=A0ABR8YRU7_9CLOT|nr:MULTISPECIES: hypothetical protein [Clostridium]MBD8046980.1 hypothetical protein [Clostridium faecium]MDU1349256.1 hypothetical protein [Clostridium argentinense]
MDYLFVIQSHIIIPLISSASVIAGTLIGALLNWIINKKITEKTINEQYKDLYDNDLINKKYRDILQKLDKLCYLENLKNFNEEL